MNKITKLNQPNSLIVHKQSGGNYSNLPKNTKDDLRQNLLIEQGYVCCYCQKRIPQKNVATHHIKIEHFKPQNHFPQLELEYSNLHIACNGNQGSKKDKQTCDTSKANSIINSFSLINNSLDGNIKYTSIGAIISSNENINNDINSILQLNNDQNLIQGRKSVIDGLSNRLRSLNAKGKLTQAVIVNELNRWKKKDTNNKFKEYYAVAIYYLQKKIK